MIHLESSDDSLPPILGSFSNIKLKAGRITQYGYKLSVFFLTFLMAFGIFGNDVSAISRFFSTATANPINTVSTTLSDTSRMFIHNRDEDITRGELMEMLLFIKYSDKKIPECKDNPFTDISDDNPLLDSLCYAKNEGLINGYNDGTFRLDDRVNISMAAKMVLVSFEIIDNEEEDINVYINELISRNAIPTSILCKESFLKKSEISEIVFRIKDDIRDRESLNGESLKSCFDVFVNPLGDSSCGGYKFARGYSGGHTGIDLTMGYGSAKKTCWISAAGQGEVVRAVNDGGYNGGLGNYVVINHDNGTQTLYAHMSAEIIVNAGDRVSVGEKIGMMGGSGRASVVHLHFSYMGHMDASVVNHYNRRQDPTGIIPF